MTNYTEQINAAGKKYLSGPLIIGFLSIFAILTFLSSLMIIYGIKDKCGDSRLIRVAETQTWISAFLVGWLLGFIVDGKMYSSMSDATCKVWLALTITVILAVFIMSSWILSEIDNHEAGTGCNPEKKDKNNPTKKTKTVKPWAVTMVVLTTPLVALMVAYTVIVGGEYVQSMQQAGVAPGGGDIEMRTR
jgi:hypothetical protein